MNICLKIQCSVCSQDLNDGIELDLKQVKDGQVEVQTIVYESVSFHSRLQCIQHETPCLFLGDKHFFPETTHNHHGDNSLCRSCPQGAQGAHREEAYHRRSSPRKAA
jgi:hypothetical protein